MGYELTKQFRALFAALPKEVQEHARAAYRLFIGDASHPSLRFKKVHPKKPIWSARVGLHYRALGVRVPNGIVRFWIGSHADYDELLDRM